jgi:hypothetical protein
MVIFATLTFRISRASGVEKKAFRIPRSQRRRQCFEALLVGPKLIDSFSP